jgi:hypothetical protein
LISVSNSKYISAFQNTSLRGCVVGIRISFHQHHYRSGIGAGLPCNDEPGH